MNKIIAALLILMLTSVTAQANLIQGKSKPLIRKGTVKSKLQIQQRIIKLNASKIRSAFDNLSMASLHWEIDLINQGNAPIPANTMEYVITQTINKTRPVTMLRGSVQQTIPVGGNYTLDGLIKVCCAYDRVAITIKDKFTGKILVATASPMPVEPLRGKVRVVSAKYKLTPKPPRPVIAIKNDSKMSVYVKAILYRKAINQSNFARVDERKFWISPNKVYAPNYAGKLAMLDQFRIELTQETPGMICPAANCISFPTYEGNFVGQ